MGCGSSAATPVAPVSSNPRFIDISGPEKSGHNHSYECFPVGQEVEQTQQSSKFAEAIIATDIKGDGWWWPGGFQNTRLILIFLFYTFGNPARGFQTKIRCASDLTARNKNLESEVIWSFFAAKCHEKFHQQSRFSTDFYQVRACTVYRESYTAGILVESQIEFLPQGNEDQGLTLYFQWTCKPYLVEY
jgi:hypothetical protein